MINHNKNWLLYDCAQNIFFEKNFSNIFNQNSWNGYDFFYKEIYDCEFSSTRCIYEMNNCIIDNNDIVVDLGSNVGFFTDYAAKKCKKVISVEGSAQIYSCLVKNTYQNGNIEYINANIVDQNSSIHYTWSNNPTKLNLTIENLFDFCNLEKIDFLKIDIEGSEYEIFNNIDKSILKKINKIAIETHDENKNKILIDLFSHKKLYVFDWSFIGCKTTTYYFYDD